MKDLERLVREMYFRNKLDKLEASFGKKYMPKFPMIVFDLLSIKNAFDRGDLVGMLNLSYSVLASKHTGKFVRYQVQEIVDSVVAPRIKANWLKADEDNLKLFLDGEYAFVFKDGKIGIAEIHPNNPLSPDNEGVYIAKINWPECP